MSNFMYLLNEKPAGQAGSRYRKYLHIPRAAFLVLLHLCVLEPACVSAQSPSGSWIVLFDGKNTDHWRSVSGESFPKEGWQVEDDALAVLPGRKGGDLITREQFGDFELVLDFRLTDSANSGIKYFVTDIENKSTGNTAKNGIEYQIVDDTQHPEVKKDPHGTSSTAAIYLLYPPKHKTLRPLGEWNQVRIVARGKKIEHWLNGRKTASCVRGSKDFRNRVARSKFASYVDYGKASYGHILLQDHGRKVYFRNIRIRSL